MTLSVCGDFFWVAILEPFKLKSNVNIQLKFRKIVCTQIPPKFGHLKHLIVASYSGTYLPVFGGTACLQLQGVKTKTTGSSEILCDLSTRLHSIASLKAVIFSG